jgi:PAS domain S-box-containing protein
METTDNFYSAVLALPGTTVNDRQLLEMLPAAIYTCDTEGRITFYNKAAAELWGREPETGTDLWCGSWKIYNTDGTPMPPESCPMAVALREQREVAGHEIIIECPDGIRRHILPHPRPVFDALGKMAGAINMLVDITATKDLFAEHESKYRSLSELLEKKVEERTLTLKKSEERYHKMIDEVQDYAILLLDTEGNILNWNKGAENIKGYSEREILGKNFRLFYLDKDREEQLPEKLIAQAYTEGKAMHEGWRLRKDRTMFWGSIVITALHDEEGGIIGFSKVTRDLTERKLAQDRMNNYLRDIEFRNKQLEEYAYIASHDLQEPLRKIQVFAELLEKSLGNEAAAKRNLEKINSSARRMSSLIKDVLKYSQLSRADELYVATDLNTVFENILEDHSLLIEQKHVQINYHDLPVINGIPIQLHQLFSNLVNNAIKFSAENPVIDITADRISARQAAAYPDVNHSLDYVKIIFKDNGIGFEQQYGEQVFKMFKRLSDNAGTGIGLALCKKIIENHSGHIDVTSEPGRGTAFTILLPVN